MWISPQKLSILTGVKPFHSFLIFPYSHSKNEISMVAGPRKVLGQTSHHHASHRSLT
jgi:hypothetical protein